jgi:hypothetical protein
MAAAHRFETQSRDRARPRHHFAVDADLALFGGEKSGDAANKGGLAATGSADQTNKLAIRNRHRDGVEHFADVAGATVEVFREVLDFEFIGHARRILRLGWGPG